MYVFYSCGTTVSLIPRDVCSLYKNIRTYLDVAQNSPHLTEMSLKASSPNPAAKLRHYCALSPLAGVHVSVSPLQLGVMSIGDK
jgi:hypothetical protein